MYLFFILIFRLCKSTKELSYFDWGVFYQAVLRVPVRLTSFHLFQRENIIRLIVEKILIWKIVPDTDK